MPQTEQAPPVGRFLELVAQGESRGFTQEEWLNLAAEALAMGGWPVDAIMIRTEMERAKSNTIVCGTCGYDHHGCLCSDPDPVEDYGPDDYVVPF